MTNKLFKEIGARLEDARQNMGLTRYQVSRATGVQETHLKKIEEGVYNIRVGTLATLLNYYKIGITIPLHHYEFRTTIQDRPSNPAAEDIRQSRRAD